MELPNALPAGYALQEYRIERVLGVGGFGLTYLALDENLHLKVAVKEYLPADIALRAPDFSIAPRSDETAELFGWGKRRFLDESRTLASFRHPNIVRVMRFFEAHGTAYMVMEFVEWRRSPIGSARGARWPRRKWRPWWRRFSMGSRWCTRRASCIATSSPRTSTSATTTRARCCWISARRARNPPSSRRSCRPGMRRSSSTTRKASRARGATFTRSAGFCIGWSPGTARTRRRRAFAPTRCRPRCRRPT